MKLGPLVIKLRLAETRFGSFVAGAAELAVAMEQTLKVDMAFVVPLAENANPNETDSAVIQKLTERFAVIIALANDTSDKEKTGVKAYDSVHDVRDELFGTLIGHDPGYETLISYRGGRLLDINRATLWYQFEFEFSSRIVTDKTGTASIEESTVAELQQESQLPDLDTIYMNLIQSPSGDLPYKDDLPLVDSYPNVILPDMANWIDMTVNPYGGGFSRAFSSGFNFDDIDGYDKKLKGGIYG